MSRWNDNIQREVRDHRDKMAALRASKPLAERIEEVCERLGPFDNFGMVATIFFHEIKVYATLKKNATFQWDLAPLLFELEDLLGEVTKVEDEVMFEGSDEMERRFIFPKQDLRIPGVHRKPPVIMTIRPHPQSQSCRVVQDGWTSKPVYKLECE